MSETCIGCGHTQTRHVDGRGLCLVKSCRLCLGFRPPKAMGEEWIVNNEPSPPLAHRVIECGRRVHASGLREDVMVRIYDDWLGWWDKVTQARTAGVSS